MTDDLDLRRVHGEHVPDPTFRLELRRQVEAIVRVERGPLHVAGPLDDEEELIMITETRTPPEESPDPRRPRWLLPAAAAAAVAVIAALGVAASDDDSDTTIAGETGSSTTVAPPPEPEAKAVLDIPAEKELELGEYFMDPDGDPSTPLRVVFDITAPGWEAMQPVVKLHETGYSILHAVTITNVNRDACKQQIPLDPPVGPTVDELVAALTSLEPFVVTSPVTDISLFGYEGKHLTLTVPDTVASTGVGQDRSFPECGGTVLRSWESPVGGTWFGYNGEPGRSDEFWILDVEGTRLVIVKNTSPESPPEDLAELDAIFESIRIEP